MESFAFLLVLVPVALIALPIVAIVTVNSRARNCAREMASIYGPHPRIWRRGCTSLPTEPRALRRRRALKPPTQPPHRSHLRWPLSQSRLQLRHNSIRARSIRSDSTASIAPRAGRRAVISEHRACANSRLALA